MALEYSILFKEKIDSHKFWLDTLNKINIKKYNGEVLNNSHKIDVSKTHGFWISLFTDSDDYINFYCGRFDYKTKCVIRLDKNKYVEATTNIIHLAKLLTDAKTEFLLVLNGELVILHFLNNEILLNKQNDFWDLNDFSLFTDAKFCKYPII